MSTKFCNSCEQEIDIANFRYRWEKRKRSNPLKYLNNICKDCERNKGHEYYERNKNNPDFQQKTRDRAKKYARKNQVGKKSWEKRKNDLNYIKAHKQYLRENSEKIKQKQKIRGQKWHRKHCDNLTDNYISIRLKSTGYTDEMITSEIIRVKRSIIKEGRTLVL